MSTKPKTLRSVYGSPRNSNQKPIASKPSRGPGKSASKTKLIVESKGIPSEKSVEDSVIVNDQSSDTSGSDAGRPVVQIVTVPCPRCSHEEDQSHKEYTVIPMSKVKIGAPAPDWEGYAVVDKTFKAIKLSDYKGKYLVFFFYPLDFTFVCPTEIIAFSDRVEEFRQIKCEVVACSCDSKFSHLAWVNTERKKGGLGEMKIPILSDMNKTIATEYGVLKEDEGIPFRGLFIIDGKGNLRQITINDLPVGRSVDETLRLVQAFQFTDVHGEVCPAGWKPGKKTMKPDTEKSKEYFKDTN